MRDWKLGEVCEHGSLGRHCLVCELEDEIADLKADRVLLLALLVAARAMHYSDVYRGSCVTTHMAHRDFRAAIDACK